MIPSKEKVISDLENQFKVKLHSVKGKRIFYAGILENGKDILICTPESKLHSKGYGWVDITTKQNEMLGQAFEGIVAIRLEQNKLYNLNFKDLKKYLTVDSMVNNSREGDHWKLHILPNHIKVLGNKNLFSILPITVDQTNNNIEPLS